MHCLFSTSALLQGPHLDLACHCCSATRTGGPEGRTLSPLVYTCTYKHMLRWTIGQTEMTSHFSSYYLINMYINSSLVSTGVKSTALHEYYYIGIFYILYNVVLFSIGALFTYDTTTFVWQGIPLINDVRAPMRPHYCRVGPCSCRSITFLLPLHIPSSILTLLFTFLSVFFFPSNISSNVSILHSYWPVISSPTCHITQLLTSNISSNVSILHSYWRVISPPMSPYYTVIDQ